MKLLEADAIVRSKNAGPYRITLDVIFKDKEQFRRMRDAGVWSKARLARMYRISEERISDCLVYEPASAFKCTYQRAISSGAYGDTDIYGSQQHLPLYDIEF